MFKMIALLKAKAGMSREEFMRRYESGHALLVRELYPDIVGYRRNFVTGEWSMVEPGATMDFDVVTEVIYRDRAAFDAAMRGNAEAMARLVADEAEIFDRTKTRFFHVEERTSEM